jgi:hypothetical protein
LKKFLEVLISPEDSTIHLKEHREKISERPPNHRY